MKISVLGAGGWGTTLAILLHYNGHNVTLWEYQRKYAKQLIKKRENKVFLPGIEIPEEIEITNDLDIACEDKNMIVLAVPTQFLRSVLEEIEYKLIMNSIFVSVSKGIELHSTKTITQMVMEIFPGIDE